MNKNILQKLSKFFLEIIYIIYIIIYIYIYINRNLEDQFKIAEFEGVNYVENIVPIECVGQDGLMLAIEADSHGIQFSTGSACNKDGVSPTYRLLHGDKAKSIIRLSGPTKVATQEELYYIDDMISYLFETLQNIIKEQ